MKYRVYFKKWVDGTEKPVICDRADNFHLVDFSILREDVGKSFEPDKHNDKVRDLVLAETGGVNVNFKESYIGESTITWHFGKSVVSEGEVSF